MLPVDAAASEEEAAAVVVEVAEAASDALDRLDAPLRTVMGRPRSRPKGSAATTSSADSHRAITRGRRSMAPFPDDLLRLSIGIEDPGDLVADMEGALDAASRTGDSASRQATAPG